MEGGERARASEGEEEVVREEVEEKKGEKGGRGEILKAPPLCSCSLSLSLSVSHLLLSTNSPSSGKASENQQKRGRENAWRGIPREKQEERDGKWKKWEEVSSFFF